MFFYAADLNCREGFRMAVSDMDNMLWQNNNRVTMDLSQVKYSDSGLRVGAEYDITNCFICNVLPNYAFLWKNRCHSWPDLQVVDGIRRSGYHFVAKIHP